MIFFRASHRGKVSPLYDRAKQSETKDVRVFGFSLNAVINSFYFQLLMLLEMTKFLKCWRKDRSKM